MRCLLQLFSCLQSCSHQVGPEVDETNLGAGHVGDGVDGVQDGVLPSKAQPCGDERPPRQARQRSQQRRVFEESAQRVTGGGGGEGRAGKEEEECCD